MPLTWSFAAMWFISSRTLNLLSANWTIRPSVSSSPFCSNRRLNHPCTGYGSRVHGEKRQGLPALSEFLPVLRQLGIRPSVTELDELPHRGFASLEDARDTIARRIFVVPGTDAMSRLEDALEDWLVHEDGAWQIKGAQPFRPHVVAWDSAGLTRLR